MKFYIKSYEVKQHTKMFIIAIFDALIAQFYFDAVPFEFKFSISVALLPIYYYFDRSLNPIKTSLYVTSIGIIFRTLTQANVMGGMAIAFWSDFNFIYFDLCYGMILYFLFYKKKDARIKQWVFVVVFADTFSNTVEAFTRHGFSIFLDTNALIIFFLVACIRVIIGLVIITFMKQYTRLIRQEEDEVRYKELLMLTSELKSEAYFMQKNMDFIELVMEDAYNLYSDFSDDHPEKNKQLALKIATEVHEIKKNYSRVLEGLINITAQESKDDVMEISEILKILRDSIEKHLELHGSNIRFQVIGHGHGEIKDHYLLMAVLRNLVNNAIESFEDKKEGKIVLEYYDLDNDHVFTIRDTGSGIDAADLKYIFEAGFSTKFNAQTGDICRGVGLTLVKEIVENQLDGSIEVTSHRDEGSIFKVQIKK